MALEQSTERNPPSRGITPMPFRNTLYKYFMEILIFILIVVLLILKREYINNNLIEIVLMLLGVILGRVTKR